MVLPLPIDGNGKCHFGGAGDVGEAVPDAPHISVLAQGQGAVCQGAMGCDGAIGIVGYAVGDAGCGVMLRIIDIYRHRERFPG